MFAFSGYKHLRPCFMCLLIFRSSGTSDNGDAADRGVAAGYARNRVELILNHCRKIIQHHGFREIADAHNAVFSDGNRILQPQQTAKLGIYPAFRCIKVCMCGKECNTVADKGINSRRLGAFGRYTLNCRKKQRVMR